MFARINKIVIALISIRILNCIPLLKSRLADRYCVMETNSRKVLAKMVMRLPIWWVSIVSRQVGKTGFQISGRFLFFYAPNFSTSLFWSDGKTA